ncbi:hypothetical protein B0H11DRAFT_1923869 [Mycena galericulata]|nr:hypothetical protein B0H11DRAFT_1923869 [Mycena galericulata]
MDGREGGFRRVLGSWMARVIIELQDEKGGTKIKQPATTSQNLDMPDEPRQNNCGLTSHQKLRPRATRNGTRWWPASTPHHEDRKHAFMKYGLVPDEFEAHCLLTHPLSSCNFRDKASPTVCLPTQDTKSDVRIQDNSCCIAPVFLRTALLLCNTGDAPEHHRKLQSAALPVEEQAPAETAPVPGPLMEAKTKSVKVTTELKDSAHLLDISLSQVNMK